MSWRQIVTLLGDAPFNFSAEGAKVVASTAEPSVSFAGDTTADTIISAIASTIIEAKETHSDSNARQKPKVASIGRWRKAACNDANICEVGAMYKQLKSSNTL